MAKKRVGKAGLAKLVSFLMWLTGVIVALSVGFAMTSNGPLSSIPYVSPVVTGIFGWIVIITTILGVILEIVHSLK